MLPNGSALPAGYILTGALVSLVYDGSNFQMHGSANLATVGTGFFVKKNDGTFIARTIAISGSGISITEPAGTNDNPTITLASDPNNTANTLVFRDSSGNFAAGTIAANLNGTAAKATALAGGLGGQIPFQSALNTTSFLANGTAGQVLIAGGTTLSPSWASTLNGLTLNNTTMTGTTAAPTVATSDNTTSIATTAWVRSVLGSGNTFNISIGGSAATTAQTSWPNLSTTVQLSVAGSQSGSVLSGTSGRGSIFITGGSTASDGAFMAFWRPAASLAYYFGLDTDNQFTFGGYSAGTGMAPLKVNSFGVGTAASGVAGEIRATNNITSYYSDDRLKIRYGNIDNALGKLMNLNGFYYQANDVAQSLGYSAKREIGLSAQEVQRLFPEIVVPAPIDDKYLTIHYERLIPVLVEAIKQLKYELDSLKR